jgi:hypothetical protein
MSLEHLFHSVESKLFDFGRRLCKEPFAEVREEADGLADTLRGRRAALARCRDEMAALRHRVKANEARTALLSSRVESYLYVSDGPNAFKLALELDDLRRSLAADRQRLREALQVERRCLDDVGDLESRLDDLRDKLCRR